MAEDAERLARFQREAQVLASLNHPHIAAIYGLEKVGNLEALVLELVEGETLAERIAGGPIPVDEALEIARQIASALEAAHDRGIVHRDLKPANVKLTPDGKVKVLDFGLAKALTGDASSPDVTRSPTLTAAGTQAGVIIGTAAYMSPEQARGRAVDKRADIWAFGAVLYEMLSGRKAFEGETVSDMLAAVLRADIDWSALPRETPPSVRRVLRRCLDRDPKTRFHDIADARLELDEAPEPGAVSPIVSAPVRRVPWLLALARAGAPGGRRLVEGAAPPSGRGGAPDELRRDPVRRRSRFPSTTCRCWICRGTERSSCSSSDRDGRRQLFVRTRDRIEPRPVAGTEGASSPFFSPDGQWIGFFADGKLKKVPTEGGVATTLADAPNNRGGVWLADDSIVYAPDFTSGLMRVSSRGGKPEVLTTPDAKGGERTHRWPTYLPGDSAVLFTIGMLKGPGNYDDARIAVWEPATRKIRILHEGGSMARYAPSGHLVFLRAERLFALPFDASRREATGEPVVLNEKMGQRSFERSRLRGARRRRHLRVRARRGRRRSARSSSRIGRGSRAPWRLRPARTTIRASRRTESAWRSRSAPGTVTPTTSGRWTSRAAPWRA